MNTFARLSDPLKLARGPAWANHITLAPLTNWQSHADGTLGEDEYGWLTMRARGGFAMTMKCAAHCTLGRCRDRRARPDHRRGQATGA